MKLLSIGAHPDDAEYYAGGLARKFSRSGHQVKFLSMTNGDAGHHDMRGPDLAERRRQESWSASVIAGAEYQILNHHDGRLYPTMEIRDELIGLIRGFAPDLLLTHRPNDYHPDHRAASTLVQDAAYLLVVHSICPRVPPLERMPVILYMEDHFMKPAPFEADVAIGIDDVIDDKIDMLHCHESQFYEWIPHTRGTSAAAPDGEDERKAWLGEQVRARARKTAERFRVVLDVLYGKQRSPKIELAEAFEACEYGRPLTAQNRRELFPFFDERVTRPA